MRERSTLRLTSSQGPHNSCNLFSITPLRKICSSKRCISHITRCISVNVPLSRDQINDHEREINLQINLFTRSKSTSQENLLQDHSTKGASQSHVSHFLKNFFEKPCMMNLFTHFRETTNQLKNRKKPIQRTQKELPFVRPGAGKALP